MTEAIYTAFFPFCGSGPGARGFLDAQLDLLGRRARFRSLGGIDFDPAACEDFEYLTDSPALCADVSRLTFVDLVRFAGERRPDVVFLSPPCKGSSGLLSEVKSKTPKYEAMNRLAVAWMRLMLGAWGDDPPPLVLLENVPRMKTRAAAMLREIRALLRGAGYVLRDGFHDCGELGGLAQRRRRYLLVARHPKTIPPLLYQPVRRRVRACGEVLGPMPMPGDPAGGPMHQLPKISWLNWVRLALIPAGGDWRDLPGVLEDGQPRRSKFKRHRMETWKEAVGTVGGSGSNGVENVADPRVDDAARRAWEQKGIKTPGGRHWFKGKYGVTDWKDPARTVIGGPSNGAGAVADPRVVGLNLGADTHSNVYAVAPWDEPARAVTGAQRPGQGAASVADPRIVGLAQGPNAHRNKYAVADWKEPAGTVIGAGRPGSGAPSVADPRVMDPALVPETGYAHSYRVTEWDAPAGVVTTSPSPSSGAIAVADPRAAEWGGGRLGVLPFDAPAGAVAGESLPPNGRFSVADPRAPEWFRGALGVVPWNEPAGVVTGNGRPGAGKFSVADPRIPSLVPEKPPYDHAYAVLHPDEPSPTVAAKSMPGNGAYSFADPRLGCEPRVGVYGVIPWDEAAKTVTGTARIDNGAFAVADPRLPPGAPPVMVIRDLRKPPPLVPVIMSADGTWHRPLTTLELAALQGIPTVWKGAPLKLSGSTSSAWRERIGNAVPPPASRAIGERMLCSLVQADAEAFVLSGDSDVWVQPDEEDTEIVGMM